MAYAETEVASAPPPAGGGGGPAPVDPYDPYGYYYYATASGEDEAPQGAATASDFTAAQSSAQSLMTSGNARIVAVAAGGDVLVFVDLQTDHVADLAIILVGQTLSAVDASNFVLGVG